MHTPSQQTLFGQVATTIQVTGARFIGSTQPGVISRLASREAPQRRPQAIAQTQMPQHQMAVQPRHPTIPVPKRVNPRQTVMRSGHGHQLHFAATNAAVHLRPTQHESLQRRRCWGGMPTHTDLALPPTARHPKVGPRRCLSAIAQRQTGEKILVNVLHRLR